jgi:hypothetical protein
MNTFSLLLNIDDIVRIVRFISMRCEVSPGFRREFFVADFQRKFRVGVGNALCSFRSPHVRHFLVTEMKQWSCSTFKK